jgi:predicted glycoside hydrolase/deacetylase ChbG (UPF0249 family)
MNSHRQLIVNADDFGLSAEVNSGIIAAHEYGIVTSASLMVRERAAVAAAAYVGAHSRLSLGLHVDLGEWTFRNGAWEERYRVVSLSDSAAVEAEITRQLDAFYALVGAAPTHLDSHQHSHRNGPAQQTLAALGTKLNIPVRHFSPKIAYCGDFYGQDSEGRSYPELITPDALISLLSHLQHDVTELGCHPGHAAPANTMYGKERCVEVSTLCDPRVRSAAVALGIELISFHDLSGGAWH